MPRLSLWKSEKSSDYRYFDRTISEMFTVGSTDLYIHKYIGSNNPSNSTDLTQPHYDATDPTNIQDLLFLENRDRKYDTSVYRLRGHYNVQNLDFDLSQFGLFLTNDIIFITVHYNDMIDVIGRKLMVGDVFELPHLTDYHPLNETIPIGLRRYYQITDAAFASEGFSSTWFPHLWRIKCEPLVDSQEFANILNQPINKDNYMGDWDPTKSYEPGYTVTWGNKIYAPTQSVPAGIDPTNTTYWQLSAEENITDILARYNKNIEINNAAIAEAKRIVPKSGYDRSQLYVVPTFLDNQPAPPINLIVSNDSIPADPLTIATVHNKNYRNSSVVLRIPKTSSAYHKVQGGASAILESAIIAPQLTEGGSGPVSGDSGVLLSLLNGVVAGPYGTADNTYATGDQFVNFTLTSGAYIPPRVNEIVVLDIPSQIVAGLVIRAITYSQNGTPNYIFPEGTRITSINRLTNTIITDEETLNSIPAGIAIELSFDFTGTVTLDMDYLADCDPRFIFIRRSTPRSFGYLVGYLTGEEEAPNGEPFGSGIAFPVNAKIGDYFLRLDYLPQKLFRFDGRLWIEISRNVRTEPGLVPEDLSQLSTFINNDNVVPVSDGGDIPSRQSLSKFLRITPD